MGLGENVFLGAVVCRMLIDGHAWSFHLIFRGFVLFDHLLNGANVEDKRGDAGSFLKASALLPSAAKQKRLGDLLLLLRLH